MKNKTYEPIIFFRTPLEIIERNLADLELDDCESGFSDSNTSNEEAHHLKISKGQITEVLPTSTRSKLESSRSSGSYTSGSKHFSASLARSLTSGPPSHQEIVSGLQEHMVS